MTSVSPPCSPAMRNSPSVVVSRCVRVARESTGATRTSAFPSGTPYSVTQPWSDASATKSWVVVLPASIGTPSALRGSRYGSSSTSIVTLRGGRSSNR